MAQQSSADLQKRCKEAYGGLCKSDAITLKACHRATDMTAKGPIYYIHCRKGTMPDLYASAVSQLYLKSQDRLIVLRSIGFSIYR